MAGKEQREETRRMVEWARLHYERNLSQEEIRKQFHVSPNRVSRTLSEARRRGIVQISIQAPRVLELEDQIRQTYGLLDVRVSELASSSPVLRECMGPSPLLLSVKEALGREAARYLEKMVEGEDVKNRKSPLRIAIGGGRTLFEMAEALHKTKRNVRVCSTVAPLPEGTHISSSTIAGVVAAKWEAELHKFPTRFEQYWSRLSPAQQTQIPEEYRPRRNPEEARQEAAQADIILTGVGNLSADGTLAWLASSGAEPDVIDRVELERLRVHEHAVADINYQVISGGTEGHPPQIIVCPLNQDLVRCLPLSDFQRAASTPGRLVIGVSGGEEKIAALRAVLALQPIIINVLITDASVAEALI